MSTTNLIAGAQNITAKRRAEHMAATTVEDEEMRVRTLADMEELYGHEHHEQKTIQRQG